MTLSLRSCSLIVLWSQILIVDRKLKFNQGELLLYTRAELSQGHRDTTLVFPVTRLLIAKKFIIMFVGTE
jgi:hypothetical protein